LKSRPAEPPVPLKLQAWHEHWSDVWDLLAPDAKADILAYVRARFPLLANKADEHHLVKTSCLQELERRSTCSADPGGRHRCPIPGCKTWVASALIMCRPHWQLVPSPLQNAAYQAWAQRQQNPRDLTAIAEHRRAIELAVQAAAKHDKATG
jgi:hypothetical protein